MNNRAWQSVVAACREWLSTASTTQEQEEDEPGTFEAQVHAQLTSLLWFGVSYCRGSGFLEHSGGW